jgi:hypothetical protein
MSPEETRKIVRASVQETLVSLGIDISNPESVEKWQRNMAWVDDRRRLEQHLSWKVVAALAVFVVGGVLSALILGVKTILNIH